VVAWVAWRTLGVAAAALGTAPWSRNNPAGQSVLVLGEITAKTATLAIAVATLLASLGYPVGSLMAGIGIGGFGLALAAQKTVENLFGSVSLATDQPFVLGDFVRIEDFVGTIEAIGLRSTRIRTLDRTVVSIPNGRLADMRLENYSARDRMRLACTVSLVYETTPAQMRAVLARIEKVLRSHPLIWPDAVVVRFKDLAASSLDIEVMAWFQTPEWSVFQAVRQEVLLQFMEVVESAGTSFAFPTRTIHVAPSPRGDGAGADRPTASEVQR
jgi:MscS family membrane protein